jgi:tryptophanyl-tRNA synthetase
MAVGIDPKKSLIFVQSEVPAHAELSWILTCNSYTGELSRMTQFKEKARGGESAPTGLFVYPILMAADILLYDTNAVPVGSDQQQHIELTRTIAERFNNKYGADSFVVPDGKFIEGSARIMSLENPEEKMSKSATNEHSFISLLDCDAKIEKAINLSTSDSLASVKFAPETQSGVSNLLTIYSAFEGLEIPDIEKKYSGKGYGDLKNDLIETIIKNLRPIQDRYKDIRESSELREALREGRERANEFAERTLERVKGKVGLGG